MFNAQIKKENEEKINNGTNQNFQVTTYLPSSQTSVMTNSSTTKENVKLLTTSAVIGNIISKKTVIENNAFFQGHCISISEEEKFKIQSEKFLQNQSIISKVNI